MITTPRPTRQFVRQPTHEVVPGQLVALRLLVDRRDELSARRVQTVNRLHRLLTELIAGGADRDLTATSPRPRPSGYWPR